MKRNMVKLLFDVVLSVIFVLLFNTHVLGLSLHEMFGLGIGFGILIHIGLNFQWVKKASLKLIDPKLPIKTRLGYFLNLLLLMAFILIIISGIFISKVLFPHLRVGNEAMFRTLHISVSYLTLILIGIHLGLHEMWIMNSLKNLFKIKSTWATYVAAKLIMIFLLLFGGYQIAATNMTNQVANIGNVFSMTNSQYNHDGFQEQSQVIDGYQTNGRQRPEGGSRRDRGQGFSHSSSEGVKGQVQSSNLFSVLGIIIKYSGIMSLFAILTFYTEKFLTRKNVS